MIQKYAGEIGTPKQRLDILQKKSLVEAINRFPTWDIHRYESDKHRRMAKREEARIAEEILSMGAIPGENLQVPIYEEKEALDLFGVPEITHIDGNLLLYEGINEMWKLVCGTGGTQFNTGSYIGVGDSATAEAVSQTDLQASTNKLYKAMDSTYPTYGTNQYATWRSTFASADANYAWNEYTIANASSGSGINLCRKVSAQGTKQVNQAWELTYQIVLA